MDWIKKLFNLFTGRDVEHDVAAPAHAMPAAHVNRPVIGLPRMFGLDGHQDGYVAALMDDGQAGDKQTRLIYAYSSEARAKQQSTGNSNPLKLTLGLGSQQHTVYVPTHENPQAHSQMINGAGHVQVFAFSLEHQREWARAMLAQGKAEDMQAGVPIFEMKTVGKYAGAKHDALVFAGHTDTHLQGLTDPDQFALNQKALRESPAALRRREDHRQTVFGMARKWAAVNPELQQMLAEDDKYREKTGSSHLQTADLEKALQNAFVESGKAMEDAKYKAQWASARREVAAHWAPSYDEIAANLFEQSKAREAKFGTPLNIHPDSGYTVNGRNYGSAKGAKVMAEIQANWAADKESIRKGETPTAFAVAQDGRPSDFYHQVAMNQAKKQVSEEYTKGVNDAKRFYYQDTLELVKTKNAFRRALHDSSINQDEVAAVRDLIKINTDKVKQDAADVRMARAENIVNAAEHRREEHRNQHRRGQRNADNRWAAEYVASNATDIITPPPETPPTPTRRKLQFRSFNFG